MGGSSTGTTRGKTRSKPDVKTDGEKPKDCPARLSTILTGSDTSDVKVGDALDIVLNKKPPHVVTAVSSRTGKIIGTLAGTPQLARLIRCLQEGVIYIGRVDKVDGGAIYVTITRQ